MPRNKPFYPVVKVEQFAINNPISRYHSLASEMLAHSALPYKASTLTSAETLTAHLRTFSSAYEYDRGWVLTAQFGTCNIPDPKPLGVSHSIDIFNILHGATRHFDPYVRQEAYLAVKNMALATDRDGYRSPALNNWSDKNGEWRLSWRYDACFWGLFFLIGHVFTDPEPEIALAPLFDHPKPATPPTCDKEWAEHPARYWMHLITALFEGDSQGRKMCDIYPDVSKWWDKLTPTGIVDLIGYKLPVSLAANSFEELMSHWQLTRYLSDGSPAVFLTAGRGSHAQTLLEMRNTLAVPLLSQMSDSERANFHFHIAQMPADYWQRWVFQMPACLPRTENTAPWGDVMCSQEIEHKFWEDIIKWIDVKEKNFSAAGGEDYGYLFRNAPETAAEYALREMRNPGGIALVFPSLWFSEHVTSELGEVMLGRYLKESELRLETDGTPDTVWDIGRIIGRDAGELNVGYFNNRIINILWEYPNPADRERLMPEVVDLYLTAKAHLTAGTIPEENLYSRSLVTI